MKIRFVLGLLVLVACLGTACSGAQQATRGSPSDRFSRPPMDLAETPPPEPLSPGDHPGSPTPADD